MSRERSDPQQLLQVFGALLISTEAVWTYLFLNQWTRLSPVSAGSPGEIVAIAAVAFVGGVAAALVLAPLAWVLVVVLRKRDHAVTTAIVATTTPALGVGVLLFLDATSYTIWGLGLRSSDSRLLGLGLAVLSAVVGFLLARALGALSPRALRAAAIVGLALTVPAGLLVWRENGVDGSPPRLEALDGSAPGGVRNVVVLSTDGVEASHLSVYGYALATTPFLRAHADEFTVFRNAYTNNAETIGSITSVLTGRSPLSTGVLFQPDVLAARDARRTLPYLLRQEGYRTSNWVVPNHAGGHLQNLVDAFDVDNGHESATSWVEGLPLGSGRPRWFAVEASRSTVELTLDALGIVSLTNPYAEVGGTTGRVMSDTTRLRAATREIRGAGHRPFFIHTHFMGTHGPWYRSYDQAFTGGSSQQKAWQDEFYDGAIRHFDDKVRVVYETLAETGHLDDTLLIVTSDHGRRWSSTVQVPLMLRIPGQPGGSETRHVERIDLAPTILGVLGYRVPAWMEGYDLRHPDRIPRDRTVLAADANDVGQERRLVIIALRCGSYVVAGVDGVIDRGTVEGDTSGCSELPVVPSSEFIREHQGSRRAE